jgi:hypothetical protein
MVAHHSDIKQQIDTELREVFQEGGSFAYSGPAADALLSTHTGYQSYFTTLIDHAQTQQSRYSTLQDHAQTFLSNANSAVYRLPAPVAAVGAVSIETAVETDSAISAILGLMGLDLAGMAAAAPIPVVDIPIEAILAAILIILAIILILVTLFVIVKDAVSSHISQQQGTTVPKPTPAPDPTPEPEPWPWPDPIPRWLPKHDPDCIKHIAEVKAVFPDVRADLIAYLTCMEPKMSPEEVIKLFTQWTSEGMTQQDINNFLARIEGNLRLDPGQNQPTREQNIAFLRNHTQDIPDIWAKYKQVQNIPGIDAILKDMITAPLTKAGSPNPTYRGSYFQLNWVENRQTTVGDIVRVEQFVNTPPQKGPDAVLKDGTLVDTKSYIWPDQTPFFRRIHTIPDLKKQLERYRTDPALTGHPVVYIFDSSGGKLPADIQKVFDEAKARGLNVTVLYWPNANPPQLVP